MSYLTLLYEALDQYVEYVVLDTETTGLREGEICSIAIINNKGETLLDTLVRTKLPIPPGATKIHDITDEMVKDAQTWFNVREQVLDIIDAKLVFIYNTAYDRRMMHQSDTLNAVEHFDYKFQANFVCVMEAFAEFYGDWNDWSKSYTWKKLSVAARHFQYASTEYHSALGDCHATLAVVNGLALARLTKQ